MNAARLTNHIRLKVYSYLDLRTLVIACRQSKRERKNTRASYLLAQNRTFMFRPPECWLCCMTHVQLRE